MAISFLFMTRENYVRYSFYDATGCQYIEVTKMENAKGENSIKHLSLYKYGYFKPCYTIPKVVPKESLWHYNDDNDLLFTIREYAGDIVKNRSSNQNRILQVHSKKLS